jgi:hypothetical protein
MQTLFSIAPQPGQNAARSQLMSSPHRLSGFGWLGSTNPESEITGRCEERSRESAVRDSLRSYSRTGDRAPSMRPQHIPGPQQKDTPDNPLLFRDAP